MSNASLKDQLKAVASQLSDKFDKKQKHTKKKLHSVQHAAKQKPKWLEYVQYGVELLKAYFPNTFYSGSLVKPLKKGIKQDLVKCLSTLDTIVIEDKACMVKSLAYYVNTINYHKNVQEGKERVDLEGHPAGIVTALEAKYSVERHQSKIEAKKSNIAKFEANISSSEDN